MTDKEESRLLQRVTSGSKFGGSSEKCVRCAKTVYHNEKIVAAGGNWHEACLKCPDCNKRLDSTTLAERDGQVYCKTCYGRRFGPKGVGIGGAGSVHADGLQPGTTVHVDAHSDKGVKPLSPSVEIKLVQGGGSNPDTGLKPSTQSRFCSGCGHGLESGARFCPQCGNKV